MSGFPKGTFGPLSAGTGITLTPPSTVGVTPGTYAPFLVTENLQTSAYELALTDNGNVVAMNTPGSVPITVPNDSVVAFPVGSVIQVTQIGAGSAVITPDTGVTIQPNGQLGLVQWAGALLRKRSANNWVANGALSLTNPSGVGSLVAWFEADTIAQANGSAVSAWADQAATPHNLAQATGAKQPTYQTNVLGSHATVRFAAASSQNIAGAGMATNQPYTILLVGRSSDLTQSSGQQNFFDGSTTNNQATIAAMNAGVNNGCFDGYAGTAFVGSTTSDTGFHVHCLVVNSNNSVMRTGGGGGLAGNMGGNNMSGLTLGSSQSGTHYLQGDIAEFLVYNSQLSLANINAVGQYLASKYGLTWATAF